MLPSIASSTVHNKPLYRVTVACWGSGLHEEMSPYLQLRLVPGIKLSISDPTEGKKGNCTHHPLPQDSTTLKHKKLYFIYQNSSHETYAEIIY